MPLVRFTVKNEYGLGVEELYKDGVQSEDPKLVLDGVAVAGLVGVLRQLGDLAQFAAEVFHGLQEQVASTSSRSHKLVNRIQRIEASLPSIERAILSQTDHLRFAYTPGSEWHSRIKEERNHFICDDLPHFIMDSYDECREPPRLQLLDRFDPGGTGSCLRRYSDPTFFRRASSRSEVSNNEKSQRERKARKNKKRRSWQRNGQLPKSAPQTVNGSCRMQFSSTGQGQSSLSHTGSAFDMTFKSDMGDQSDSRGSKDGVDFSDCVSYPSILTLPDETKKRGSCSSVTGAEVSNNGSMYRDEQTTVASDDNLCSHAAEATVPRSSSATWDEILEIVEPTDVNYEIEDIQQVPVTNTSRPEQEAKLVNENGLNHFNDFSEHGSTPKSKADEWYPKTASDGNFIDPTMDYEINEVRDLLKPKIDLHEHYAEPARPNLCMQVVDLSEGEKSPQPTTIGNLIHDSIYRRLGTTEAQYSIDAKFIIAEKELGIVDSVHAGAVNAFTEDANEVKAIEWSQQQSETVNTEHVSQIDNFCEGGKDVKLIRCSHQNMEVVNPELVSQGDGFSDDGNREKVIEWNQLEVETNSTEHVSQEETFSDVGNNVKRIQWNQQEVELRDDENVSQVSTFTEDGNSVHVIEWNQLEDIDSGTENFVDALNTIESESESDFETEMKKEVQATALKDELGEDTVNSQTSDIRNHLVPGHQHVSASYDHKEGGVEDIERSTAYVSSSNMQSPHHIQSSHDKLDSGLKDEMGEDTVNGQTSDIRNHLVPDHQHVSASYDHKEGGLEDMERSTAYASSSNVQSPYNTQSSHERSESAEGQKLDVSRCLFDKQSMETSQSASLSNVPRVLSVCANVPEIEVEPAVCEIAKSDSEAPGDERNISASHVPPELSTGSSATYSPALWTNGFLLGLQPSKPTVFGRPNSGDSAQTSNSNEVGQCNLDAMQKVDHAGILASSVNKIEHVNNLSQQRLEKTHNTTVGYDKSNLSDHPMVDPRNGDAMLLESKVSIGTNVKDVSSEATGASEDRSSLLSLLGRGLLKNGLRRTGSLGFDESHESSSPLKTNEFENRFQNSVSHSVPETDLKGKLNSPVSSPPPSPPLEHMKISFQPVDGFDTSRLKLKYPEGVDHYENSLDAFPSFQLVPESTKLQHDIGSDSDDDTFCRSYAYMSDESLSQSDSNFEQWESGDSTESNDHTLYNGLHRISSAESASVSPQHKEADQGNTHVGSGSGGDAHPLSNPSFGLPILDAKNPFTFQEMKLCLNPEVNSSHLQDPTHEPPPLPPLQWRVSRPPFDELEDNQDQRSDSPSPYFVPKLSNSAIAHPVKVDSAKLISTTEDSASLANPKKGEDKKLGQEKTNHAVKDREMDDNGDFLHQIRTKSFNLKRTEPIRSTYSPTPATSNKLTAILQKANAIRQVVGSDDGEDDSWSDT